MGQKKEVGASLRFNITQFRSEDNKKAQERERSPKWVNPYSMKNRKETL
nr:MAG TPA: hypothetical protein [Caudoviricetes sp.]